MIKNHDNFPNFRDGDVKVVVTGSRQYQLHSNVLKQNSPVLRYLLEERVKPAPLDRKAKRNGITTKYKLVLAANPFFNTDEEDANKIEYAFEPVPLDHSGRQAPNCAPLGTEYNLENGRVVPDIFLAYDAVLGAFYNVPIHLGDAQTDGLTQLLSMALQITTVAEYLDCVHIITNPIEATLLATGQHLLKAIANNPTAWLSFGHRIKSKAIFRESLIHAAGQFNQPAVQQAIENGEIEDDAVEILKKKAEEIAAAVTRCERHLASYYPTILMREKTVGRVDRDNIGRANYANDIIMWIALSIFRHWVCDMMASEQTHHAKDLGWAFINAVALGGDTYLSKQVLQGQFHLRFPMSPKGMACIEHRLAEIKEVIKQWTVPLMKNESHLDRKASPQHHFLFTQVRPDDYPWTLDQQAIDYDNIDMPLSELQQGAADGQLLLTNDDDEMQMHDERTYRNTAGMIGKEVRGELNGVPSAPRLNERAFDEKFVEDDGNGNGSVPRPTNKKMKETGIIMIGNGVNDNPGNDDDEDEMGYGSEADTEEMDPQIYDDYLTDRLAKEDAEKIATEARAGKAKQVMIGARA